MTFAEDLELLGLDDGASVLNVKEAFRVLAHRHHPDLGGDVAAFQRCREAYDRVLADAKQRESVCPECNGLGYVELRNGASFIVLRQRCHRCS